MSRPLTFMPLWTAANVSIHRQCVCCYTANVPVLRLILLQLEYNNNKKAPNIHQQKNPNA